MTNILLIQHRLSHLEYTGAQVEQVMADLGDWIEIEASAYLLYTEASADEVRDGLREVMDKGDPLQVARISEAAARRCTGAVGAFLQTTDKFGFAAANVFSAQDERRAA